MLYTLCHCINVRILNVKLVLYILIELFMPLILNLWFCFSKDCHCCHLMFYYVL